MTLTLETLAVRVEQLERALEQLQPPNVLVDENQQAFAKERVDLLQKFPDEYVAYVSGKFADHDPDRTTLLDRVYAKFPGQKVFYKQLIAVEPVKRLSSPHHANS